MSQTADPLEFVVIDYGMGNLRSVSNAFAFLDCRAAISDDPAHVARAQALVLPGVGAFGEAMQNLGRRGLIDPIKTAVLERKVPMLGICLGMQLVAAESEERGRHEGLGLIPGAVRRLEVQPPLRLPHIGWNTVEITQLDPFFTGIADSDSFYFVHSYHLETDDRFVAARSTHGRTFVAALQHGHIFATQFHPERSQTKGLRLLRNFVNFARATQTEEVARAQ